MDSFLAPSTLVERCLTGQAPTSPIEENYTISYMLKRKLSMSQSIQPIILSNPESSS